MYGVLPYYLAKVTSEMPNFIMFPTLLSLFTYFGLNLNYTEASPFFIHWFISLSAFVCNGGMGLLLGIVVPSKQTGLSLAPVAIMPLQLFSGFFV